jgi:hypothetical protein
MTTTRVFTVAGGSVSNGASDELTESDNEDFVIEYIRVLDEEDNLGVDSDVTIQIGGNSITDQVIPLDDLAKTYDELPELNIVWPSNKQLRFSYTNDSGNSITLKFVVYVREATSSDTDNQPGEVLGTAMGMM